MDARPVPSKPAAVPGRPASKLRARTAETVVFKKRIRQRRSQSGCIHTILTGRAPSRGRQPEPSAERRSESGGFAGPRGEFELDRQPIQLEPKNLTAIHIERDGDAILDESTLTGTVNETDAK